jgi:hypothetical protein
MDFACPKCRFLGAAIDADGSRRCMSCGHVWVSGFAYPEPPAAHGVVAPSPGRRVGLAILAGVVAVFVLVVIAIITLSATGGSNGTEPYLQPEPAPAVDYPVATGPLAAELGVPVTGEIWGSSWWLIEYRNTGGGTISFPKLIALFKDADGNVIDRVEATSNVYSLPPGDSAWILVTPAKAKGASATFDMMPPEGMQEWSAVTKRLELSDFRVDDNPDIPDYGFLSGKLRNTSGRSMESVLVQAVGYDAKDQPCAYTLGYAEGTPLAAGATTGFRISAGTWQKQKPARWEIHAWGTVTR